jgi:outer membrane protein assembly factor BamA
MTRTAVTLLLLALAIVPPFARGAEEQRLTVEDLACRGNASTSCTFILGQLYLAPGDAVDEEEIANAQLRLSVLQNFSSVSIYLEKGSARGKARVIVEVVERSPVITDITFGVTGVHAGVLQEAAGRLTHTNLFGTGKIFDMRAGEFSPIDSGTTDRQAFARIAYVDPHLFDSKRNFMAAGIGYVDRHFVRASNGDELERRQLGMDITFGRRLWDFSHFSMGYQYRPIREFSSRIREEDGHFVTRERLRSGVLIYSFGWNTEDDPYFPTRGSVLSSVVIASGGESENWNTLIRKTWSWRNTAYYVQLATPTDRALGFSRPIGPNDLFGGVRRGRWSISLTSSVVGHAEDGRDIHGVGLRAAVALETQSYGIVRFFVFRNTEYK